MADRTVKVSLTAQVSNYLSGMEQARKSTMAAGTSAEDAKAKFEKQNETMTAVGTGLVAVGALAAVGVGLAVKKFAEFDQAMSSVQASTHESASNMQLLRDAAIDAGAKTVFSATEAANAIDELSKAGVSTADVLGGALSGSLDLASAGGLGVADAASIAATALTQFKLKGSDVPHVADLLAAGAGKAQGSVEDLSMALKQGGLVASQAGMSLDDTTGTLAAFASAGLIGSDAGTSLKTMLLSLEKPSTAASNVMDQYGIKVYDAQGNMKSFSGIADQLKSTLGGLTAEQRNSALATIFGTDAVRAASVLYDQGAKGIDSWNAKVNDSGYAAETARLKLDNLNGDIEQLGGSFDTALIKSGAAANDTLRFLTQTLTEVINAFSAAPPIVQEAALALGVLIAGVSLTGGTFLIAIPKIAAFQVALATMAASDIPAVAGAATKLSGALSATTSGISKAASFLAGPWGLALAAAAVGVALLTKYIDSLQASSDQIANSLATATSAAQLFEVAGQGKDIKWVQNVKDQLKDLPDVLQASADQAGNLFARFDSSHFGEFDALKEIGTQLGTLAGSDLPNAQKSFRLLTKETDGTQESQWRLLNTMPAYKDALTAQATTLGINVTSTDEAANKTALLGLAFGSATPTALSAATAYTTASDAAERMNQQVLALIDSVNKANGVGQDAVTANNAYANAVADLDNQINNLDPTTGKVKDTTNTFVATLNASTKSGRDNMDALAGIAKNSEAAALAQFNVDGNTAAYQATLAAGRQTVLDHAAALGATDEQLAYISDHMVAMPTEKEITIIANTAAATAALQRIKDALDNIVGATLRGPGVTINPFKPNADGNMHAYANGGFASGIYAGRAGGIHKFAEPETGWEAYISGKPGMEKRNAGIATDALARLGYTTPAQYSAPSSVSSGPASMGTREGDQFIINEATDGRAVALEVQRRQAAGVA